MRIVWRVLQIIGVGPWRPTRASAARRASLEFNALDADFFARGAAIEAGVGAGTDEWDTNPRGDR